MAGEPAHIAPLRSLLSPRPLRNKNTMSTIAQELNQLERAINQNLTSHREQLTRQQDQMSGLTQLLNARKDDHLDPHCISAINRLIELLNTNQQSTSQVQNILNSLTQAKDAKNLTVNDNGDLVTSMELEVGELAKRLKIDSPTQISTAANSSTTWAKLMNAHPDPDGYQWQRPVTKRFKLRLYHQTHLQITGTKAVKLVSGSVLN